MSKLGPDHRLETVVDWGQPLHPCNELGNGAGVCKEAAKQNDRKIGNT